MQLLYPLLYGPHIDALLQDNEEELDSHVWFDKPWCMPTQYALDLAARFMAEDSKPTPTPANIYLTAAADLALNIDEKKEQKEHIAMLLGFYETYKDDGDRGSKGGRGDGGRGRGRGRDGGRGLNDGGDSGAPRKADPWPTNFSRQ